MYPQVNPKQSFPALEREMLAYWKVNNTFKKSLAIREGAPEFNFYDGPPFATGTPHYGHLLAGTIKDVIPRYQTMQGKYVERRFGWDCHGLPIENIVEKKMSISGKKDIEEKIGVYEFNEGCRANVFGYTDIWKQTVERMGRWVDMDNDYKTMDTPFMESVWWVFSEIYKKGLIYESYRVVPYCPRCSTPLSNFEVNQGYEDKQDKAVTVKFKVKGSANKYILAWTTTPWTLPANLGLAVGADIVYVELSDKASGETYILAKERIASYYKNPEDYTVIREYPGSCLVGIEYEPMFDDFITLQESGDLSKDIELGANAYHIVPGHHVTTESGTGVVHIAPAYGEDDFQIGKRENLGFISHIDAIGHTTGLLCDNDVYVFDYNQIVIDRLKAEKKIIHIGTIDHSYPHCYRCHTPLIYRAISAWYVNVESIKDKMIANNEKITWVPDTIKHGRFGKWVEGARDWNISRNRYWGSALPVWKSEDGDVKVIGSVEELYQANREFGQIYKEDENYFYTETKQPVDLHKHFVDKIFLQNPKAKRAKKVLGVHGFKRTDAVIDFLQGTKKNLGKEGIQMDVPTFEIGENISYENWQKILDDLDVSSYDTILAHSMGSRMIMNYLIENNIQIERLILVSPALSSNRPEIINFYEAMKQDVREIKKYVKEIIILQSEDDPVHDLSLVKQTSDTIGANFVETNGFGHFNVTECKIIEGLVKYGTPMRRIPEVLDCWFESGSMPYASKHYPFEGKDDFKFPADFIAEGLDQTRGWFYTLLILGTALFDNTPFLNVIVNGMILAEDGKKMSKSLSNYPDPMELVERHGADALRFYMLSSPVVKADDLRFSEAGVEEVVKKVLLPLWNTYSFFTTYANIDKWQPSETKLTFMRHGETDANLGRRISDAGETSPLNETGKTQAQRAGKQMKQEGKEFDIIIVSPAGRTQETAQIAAQELGYTGEFVIIPEFIERHAGDFSGKSFTEIEDWHRKKTGKDMDGPHHYRTAYEHGNGESEDNHQNRVAGALAQILEKYAGKRILIVAHGGTFRACNTHLYSLSMQEGYREVKGLKNCETVDLPVYQITNRLDAWIISRLNRLIAMVEGGFETYDLQIPTRAILEFMDELTNWYIRRSRRRFWKSENDGDKLGAYETLYHVLVTLTQVMAPITPMISEAVYRGLTGAESIHLERFPEYSRTSIFPGLDADMNRVREIITLGLALRGQKKIRVRQPLASITIGEPLSEYFQEIICEELNVKEVKIEDMSHVARKICKPNAKLIGAKFGKAVQDIIREAKAGNFSELDGGRIQVGEHILEESEYEIAYEPIEGVTLDVMSGSGMVIAMDTTLTDKLEMEGMARDIVRAVQDLRKQKGYNITDRIIIEYGATHILASKIIEHFGTYIQAETLAEKIEIKNISGNQWEYIETGDNEGGLGLAINIQKITNN